MYNLMEHHVSIVENLMMKRAPFRDQAVLYFVEPNETTIGKIIEDWTPNTETKRGPLYGNTIFLYFLGRLPGHLFKKIKGCKELVKRVKVLKEVNLDFLTKEARAFHFDMGKSTPEKESNLYSELYLSRSSSDSPSAVMDRMMCKLVTVCATLNEYPHIRYPANNELCENLAMLFHKKMNEFVGSNLSWWYNGDGTHASTARSTLLLLDRKDDCLSPLIHEFTYEAMVNDLLDMEDDKITYESINAGTAKESEEATSKMDALLNDNDEVWVELRGKHIADVIQTLSTKIRVIVNSSTGSALGKSANKEGKALSVNQMAKALKALPEYREIMSKLSQHMQIAHQCMDAFNRQGLLDLSDVEQTLATGKDDEERTPKLKELLIQVVEALRNHSDSLMRFRILSTLIVSQRGLSSQGDLEKLLHEAQLSPEHMQALQNLEKMGCPLVKEDQGKGSKLGKLRSKSLIAYGRQGTESESEYSSSRYVSLLKALMEDVAAGNLSVTDYPSVMPLPDPEQMQASTSSKAKTVRKKYTNNEWGKKEDKAAKKKISGGRQLVFMAGGMCYSELRAAREVMEATGTDVVVGSTRFIAPNDFIADIVRLS